jgi:hypothetical protein
MGDTSLDHATWALALATGLVALVAVSGAVFAWFQFKDSKTANQLRALADLFSEYRTPTMREARKTIYHRIGEQDPAKGITGLDDDVQTAAFLVGHYLDQLGTFVELKLIDVKSVSSFLGMSALSMWGLLMPFVEAERRIAPSCTCLEAFEALAIRIRKDHPEMRIKQLPRWNPTT